MPIVKPVEAKYFNIEISILVFSKPHICSSNVNFNTFFLPVNDKYFKMFLNIGIE